MQLRKANNEKYSKTKPPWFSSFLRRSTRKRDGMILQHSRAHCWWFNVSLSWTIPILQLHT